MMPRRRTFPFLAGACLLLACSSGGKSSSNPADAAGAVGGTPVDAAVAGDAASTGGQLADAASVTPDAGLLLDAAPLPPDAAPPPAVWEDEQDTDWTPAPPAGLGQNLPEVPAERPADCQAQWIVAVRGYIVSAEGKPQFDAKGQVCVRRSPSNNRICIRPGDADADGVFTVILPEEDRCVNSVVMRVIQPSVGKATTYCPVDIEGTGPIFTINDPLVVFQTRRAHDLPPQGDTTAMRPISFDDGLTLDFTPEAFYSGGGDYVDLGARRVDPTSRGLCFFGADNAPEGLYALYPEGTVDAPGFPLHMPNPTGVPAGGHVEFSVLGGLECTLNDGTSIPEAEWMPFGNGTVSADGTTIDSDPGVGLPCLTWVGYRRIP